LIILIDMSVWPDSKKMAVVLSFDLDAESLWIARDPKNLDRPVTLSQGEYGPRMGVPRILRLLKKYDLKATFFVTGWAMEHYPKVVEEIVANGHEVGHHGYHHEWLDNVSLDEEKSIMAHGISLIKEFVSEGPFGYRSPSWEFTSNTIRLLRDNRFKYTSNMMNSDLPYLHRLDGVEIPLVEVPVSWVMDDAPYFLYSTRLMGRTITDPMHVYSIWEQEYSGFYEEGLCFVLTMHPQIIGRPSRIAMLEKLIRRMRSDPGVWFAQGSEVADHWLREHR
jgi:peptidoglycan/xylan/chitin deacetylase (PgdA/CDA1 family)